ncbi:MAG: choline dehydrogenase, partial [Rhodospirillaceae bacterium]|nr:choline dehydrogenase [Rhodospirillaceae bacterium]
MATTYDYIIVGAGSAGCVLANRLSADPSIRVLLLEAGPRDRSLFIHMPAAFTHAISRKPIDWGYFAEPEPHLDGHREACPRGKVLGGSSSINSMAFVRGHPLDYDHWAETGLRDWSFACCLPYFKRMETFSGGPDAFRGGSGPLNVTQPVFTSPLNQIFLEAAGEAGFPLSGDTNGAREGFGAIDQTIHRGRRVSTATAYVRPISSRANLEVRTGCQVTRVVIENGRAVGVELLQGAGKVVRADREVLLCGGAINSPQLLMLSGIGGADALRRHDIAVVADRPEVGRNLQDHIDVSVMYACSQTVTQTPCLSYPRKALIGIEWLLTRGGLAATNHFEAAGCLRTDDKQAHPNIQVFFIPLAVSPDGKPLASGHGYQATVMLLRPRSRGDITLHSADPVKAPRLRFNYLGDSADAAELADGVAAARRIFSQPAFKPYQDHEVLPGAQITTAD